MAGDGASSIQVAVRVRPFTIREAAQLRPSDEGTLFLGDGSLAAAPTPRLGQKGLRSVIKVVDEKCLIFDPPEDNPVQRFSRSVVPQGKRSKDQTFGFDRVFDENTTQGDVYEATTKNLLDSVLDGYNATVFAYGATGCGKTHTITGTAQQPGIIFLTMQELFEKVEELQAEKESEITLSYLEIYNETIRDLLSPGAGGKQGLMLREDASQAVSVAGLSSHKPQNVQEVMDMVIQGNSNRTQSPTEANATSSRSHAVLQVNIRLKDRNASVNEPVTMATLSIIDLAGSERASATKNRGERLLEGANINKSLLALGSCINALCDPRKKNHVPYRNSKLTRLLKFSLGGNCRTVMIVCVSPSSQHFDETQNTLRYANRAKNIQTKSVRNVYNVDRHVKDYLKKIDEQMNRINELTAQQKQYEELAFVKFRKAEAKRTELEREGVARIRTAYDHSAQERKEHINNMRRLRQIERRIGAVSGWVGAFDQVCETRDEEEPPVSLLVMRKTAQGILVELEGSRQHYHQRLNKSNWTRAIDTALQDGLRQLQSLDGAAHDSSEESTLRKEVELLKARAGIEGHLSVLEQEKLGEAGLMQVMLTAHFETVAIINQIMQMTEDEALQAARDVLGKLLQSCTEATGQVIKPDGGLQITEAVPTTSTRNGTPRKRKQVPLMGPSPTKNKIRQSFASALPTHMGHELDPSSNFGSSPGRAIGTPRRRVKLGGAKKGVAFGGTPKKKSPTKKRAVRWRDDAEDGGALVEFQATPKKFHSSPLDAAEDGQGAEMPSVALSYSDGASGDADSSPLPAAPVPSSEVRKSGAGRFAAGFLSKKVDGSPASAPPTLSLGSFSSDEENSPLREMHANAAPHRASMQNIYEAPAQQHGKEDDSRSVASDSDKEKHFAIPDKETTARIRSAMRNNRRTSSLTGPPPAHHMQSRPLKHSYSRDSLAFSHRRRSPTASSRASPPPEDGSSIFSASHARRMVKCDKEDPLRGVLSPKTVAVMKNSGPVPVRRSMIETSSGNPREGMAHRPAVRVSSIVPSSANRASGAKAAWR
ncbi:kinesin-domain-containing protein [Teratosphaeria nubilosa]|uniref:Kinesin-domain-containing protein n=1 Tax=Teratosphaeria nubilosa TaxID=161662 RepID=A0A6G1LK67_9PEZI|nr:kinesin-domain-containing protein [Teratosphaeria nubilosa]